MNKIVIKNTVPPPHRFIEFNLFSFIHDNAWQKIPFFWLLFVEIDDILEEIGEVF